MSFSSSQSRWQAVRTRCQAADSSFIYAVTTTRIYCRPTCPARLARQANIVFFETAAFASSAGYRPCKRCRPECERGGPNGRRSELVARACRMLSCNQNPKRPNQVAKDLGLSSRYFHSLFKEATGQTPTQFSKTRGRTSDGEGERPPHSPVAAALLAPGLSQLGGSSNLPEAGWCEEGMIEALSTSTDLSSGDVDSSVQFADAAMLGAPSLGHGSAEVCFYPQQDVLGGSTGSLQNFNFDPDWMDSIVLDGASQWPSLQ